MDQAYSWHRFFRHQVSSMHVVHRQHMLRGYIPILSTYFCRSVFLVSSVPGVHRPRHGYQFGHPRIRDLLAKYCTTIDDSSPIIAQCSSFGRFNRCLADSWLTTNILTSFGTKNGTLPEIKIVYPTLFDVLHSHNKLYGGGSLMYTKEIHDKQKWIKRHMNQWKWDGSGRSHAMPHIKSYCRLSESKGDVYWFWLTSANLSASAMGGYSYRLPEYGGDLFVNNYETGVLFLPQFVLVIYTYTPCFAHIRRIFHEWYHFNFLESWR